ncbi:COG1496: Uncharacterized conserved protein [hydrothermal vent metagenome]|uniref:COG1496: Uncharacterized conserved protein n=1 Tax=hydrothermal vent metagenome TaxID=652676 RepID=A0A1W1CTL1_9ZZZZ
MQIIQSNLLKQFSKLTQGFTTKDNGNIAFHVNDDKYKVILNHKTLAEELKYDVNTLVHMKQIHSTLVKVVDVNDTFLNPPTCDALITNKKNVPLMVMVADCSPLLFYDSKKEVIAVVHAGRAGAFGNIIQTTLDSFTEDFDSHPDDIFVSIGASIKSCCYEVGEEVVQEAINLNLGFAIAKRKDSYYLNISAILKEQLSNEHIPSKNIEFQNECTCCNNNKYFSYRVNKNDGRFAGIICLS